ncbi:acetyl-CoA C-acetyltransferase [Rhizorhabdus dicambivorans]|uniref:Acetyl-CoA C-acyltransferase n=1 Tax=Rhizorhabdus dicambivorans TaxID=1850238 RepID=A0A2A4FR16_9SPHN|nr:acetyl-CoA C-acetyltransferase [Rhizorhabdus dicambivorans]ATE64266.1 acetyl-CoA C-acyltransferase [Rhizorhabdus dicambivorans]PCE40559.1 acetyl-CoA C-acyltransferase [Rhizorhabdus dicambivorans]
MKQAYIVAAARTAGGRRGGRLSGWHPADLGGRMLDHLAATTGIDPAAIDDVIMGCVSQAGAQANNVARYSVLASSLPESVPATTVDRQCGSSQQAVQFAAQAVMSGMMDVVFAAGVESMSRVPMGTPVTAATAQGLDGPFSPAMERRYKGVRFSQFAGAEAIARKHGLTKDELDQFALDSHLKAAAATRSGAFDGEILPIEITGADGATELHRIDEGIRFDASFEGIAGVKLLQEGGMLTAATSSQVCDGASGVVVVGEDALKRFGLTPLARLHHMSVGAEDPVINLEAPLAVTRRALDKAGMRIGDIDLYEVNEAFAPIPLAWLRALDADPVRLNVHGGAIALGHPLGASGTKLMATLIHALRAGGKRYGLQTMCEGGGQANVTILEAL